ncbi:hypothetical protein Btru_073163 [Bulinus truncatus]|nr:hypothetical protein Btru_073163 [Bulinus truncatus]
MAALNNTDEPFDNEKPYKSWVEEVFKENDPKPVRLSLHKIVERHLPPESSECSHDEIIKELNKIRRIRLDRENIGQIDSFELLNTQVTHLYLQFNKICKIESLECLPNLQVLILSENMIKIIEGIDHLQKLVFLDISNNCIEELQTERLPQSIIILNMSGNPCVNASSYRSNLIKWLPKLKHLDGTEISKEEKIDAGVFDIKHAQESDKEQSIKNFEKAGDDESDEDEESDDDVENKSDKEKFKAEVEPKKIIGFKQLPQIQTNIHDLTTNILMRSQSRMEDRTREHKKHVQEIINLKILSKIKPIKPIKHPLKQRDLSDLK